MKELLALHAKILALPEETRPEEGVNFSRAEEDQEGVDELPADLQAELRTLWRSINEVLPEGFEYFAFAGDPEDGVTFGLEYEQGHVGSSENGTFVPERTLIEQLREMNWEEAKARAGQFRASLDNYLALTERMNAPLRATKTVQREFREEMQPFVREKRVDVGRIHVLYQDEEHGLLEIGFGTADELRDLLPSVVARGSEVITIIAWGKPLPVERIDALMKEAQTTLRERAAARTEASEKGSADERHEA